MREFVDEVAAQTDTPIVEVIEYAILSTYRTRTTGQLPKSGPSQPVPR